MEDREDRIRARAYELWLLEGKPEGRDLDHWFMAAETIRLESFEQSVGNPNPAAEVINGYLSAAAQAHPINPDATRHPSLARHDKEPATGMAHLVGEIVSQRPRRDERPKAASGQPRLVALHRSGSAQRQGKTQIRHH